MNILIINGKKERKRIKMLTSFTFVIRDWRAQVSMDASFEDKSFTRLLAELVIDRVVLRFDVVSFG